MFKRVILEDWHTFVPYLCFALIAGSFIIIVLRAMRMPRKEIERISSLPLIKDEDRKIDTNSENGE